MGLFSDVTSKLTKRFLGERVAHLGGLPMKEYGAQISFSIWRYQEKHHRLVVRVTHGSDMHDMTITRLSECADQLEKIAREIREYA